MKYHAKDLINLPIQVIVHSLIEAEKIYSFCYGRTNWSPSANKYPIYVMCESGEHGISWMGDEKYMIKNHGVKETIDFSDLIFDERKIVGAYCVKHFPGNTFDVEKRGRTTGACSIVCGGSDWKKYNPFENQEYFAFIYSKPTVNNITVRCDEGDFAVRVELNKSVKFGDTLIEHWLLSDLLKDAKTGENWLKITSESWQVKFSKVNIGCKHNIPIEDIQKVYDAYLGK